MGWRADFAQDVALCRAKGLTGMVNLARHRGLWAVGQYRLSHAARRSRVTTCLSAPLHLAVEVATGASISSGAQVGPGLHISHPEGVVIAPAAKLGAGCHITHGVTIGVALVNGRRGAPTIGDRVYIGPHAVVVGPITVGDDAFIAANCVVSRDVPAGARIRPAASIMELPAEWSA